MVGFRGLRGCWGSNQGQHCARRELCYVLSLEAFVELCLLIDRTWGGVQCAVSALALRDRILPCGEWDGQHPKVQRRGWGKRTGMLGFGL